MNNFVKAFRVMICFFMIAVFLIVGINAHSGRTDNKGGHKDNNNVSGLGYYHYHCGGYPAHLHEGGYCPYKDVFPKSVTINLSKKEFRLNEEIEVVAAVSPSNACNTKVTLESSNPSVIKISGNKLIAVGYGTAVVTGTSFNGKTSSVNVNVKEVAVETVSIDIHEVGSNIYVGDNIVLLASITPYDADNKTVVWNSSDSSVATVNDDGTVQAVSVGTVEITATSNNGVVGKISLNVQAIEVEEIKVSKETINLSVDETVEINVEIIPSNATYQEVVWKSSDDTVVTVENGTVKAIGVGSATITAETPTGIKTEVAVNVSDTIEKNEENKAPGNNSGYSENGTGNADDENSGEGGDASGIIGGIAVVGIGAFVLSRKKKKGKR